MNKGVKIMIMQGNNLTELDIIDMYKETFNIDEVCHVCGKNKMCIDDMSGDLENPCFICFDCDEKRHNAENEYERREQMHDEV